jgi:hypothetical protein
MNRFIMKVQRYLLFVAAAILLAINASLTCLVYAQPALSAEQKFPDVLAVSVKARGNNHFDFDATIASPYDTPQRYADAFRVMSTDGVVYGVRTLFHDHADEQPFTRDLYGISIAAGVSHLIIQARDRQNGYGGKTVTVTLPGR